MNKILIIVAIVLCIAIAGTALAVTVYYDAKDVDATVEADNYVVLSLDGSSEINSIALIAGESTIYKIHCDVSTSATNEADGTLTVKLNANNGKNLNGVSVTLYTDAKCTEGNEVMIGEDVATATGDSAEINLYDIDESIDYFAKVSFAGAANEEDLKNVNGYMTIDFKQA